MASSQLGGLIMTTNQLKVLAVVTMLIDHMGYIFFPQMIIWRVIGRLAFPIFAFLIANGYKHTRNVYRYGLRLLIFAMLSEVPFDLAFSGQVLEFNHQNVFFTLFLGLVAIAIYDKTSSISPVIGIVVGYLIGMTAQFMGTDYGLFGVFMILGVYIMQTRTYQVIALIVINVLMGWVYYASGGTFLQAFAAIGALILFAYNGKKGKVKGIKYLFYGIYPLHLLLFYFVDHYYVG